MAEAGAVKGFFDQYRFLSNFPHYLIIIDDIEWTSTEHYYQAMKSPDLDDQEWVRQSDTAGIAKKRGKRLQLREDWESVKEDVMRRAIRAKFTQHHDLKMALIATGNAYLEETNSWGDSYWGVVAGKGKNRLGHLLMELREELRMEQFYV